MTGSQCGPQSVEVTGGPIKLFIPGIFGPVAPFVAPHLVGRVEETGNLVPIPLGPGLSIVDGTLTVASTGTGTVTSVGLTVPTGFSIANSPITNSGTLAISFAAGYSLPTTAKQGQWDQAFADLGQARTPTAHKSTHATGGADALSPAAIGAATAAQGAKADTAVQPAELTKAAVGLDNVDNTSDADKPVSTATATALGGKAGTGAIGSSGLTMATARLLGRTTAGAGAVEEIQVSGGTFANGVLTLSGLPSTLTADASGNLTFTARWIQSTNGAASAPPMSLTGTWFSGGTTTTTKPQLLIEPAGTASTSWSAAGTGLGVNAPSGFAGDLAWFGVNNVSRFAFSSDGNIRTPAGGLIVGGTNNTYTYQSGSLLLMPSGQSKALFGAGTANISDLTLCWTSNTVNQPVDLQLARDAANTLAQRNGTNAQTSRIYNTFTDASNYERLAHTWVSNVCYTRPENAGTGSARLYVPVTGGATVSGLPAATPALTGARSFVTDANATTFMSTVAGGGSNRVPVVCDGTSWLIG